MKDILGLQTPCFVLSEDDFVSNIKNFKRVLKQCFPLSIVGYSFKTNSLPRLLSLAVNIGCYAEVVSTDEYRLAQLAGFDSKNIILNGPVKDKEIFFEALACGSLINIDSNREIDWLIEAEQKVNVGIRVNFDLEGILPGQTSTKENGGRFGFCYENRELHRAIHQLRDNGIGISRLHMHVSNASKSVEVYRSLAEKACVIIDEEKIDVEYIDFGGGYFGGGDNGEAYEQYIIAIYDVLKSHNKEKIGIIVEPGASVVATSFSYVTSVVDRKKTTYGDFVVTDGTRLHIDPFMTRTRYNYHIITNQDTQIEEQVICGYSCMEKDRFMKVEIPKLEVGDKIVYSDVGSYTMCFNSLFISYLPRVYGYSSAKGYELVREKWGTDEYLQKCRW